MPNREEITLDLQFRFTMRKPEDFNNVVQLQLDTLPEYTPTKWGYFEPLRNIFYPNELSGLNPKNAYNIMESIFWKRTGRDRAEGSWSPRRDIEVQSKPAFNHASTSIYVNSTSSQRGLISFLKSASSKFPINFGFIESSTEQYRPYGSANGIILCASHCRITTHLLRHWLPDILWCTVFGPEYINLFGKERLLSAPAYQAELLNDEAFFLQLTPDLNDLWTNFDTVMNLREKVKRHLGYEAFYQKKLHYVWQDIPGKSSIYWEKAGQVYKVPTFNFIEDGTPPPSVLYQWSD